MSDPGEYLAVNWRDVRAWGCPYCGRQTPVDSDEFRRSDVASYQKCRECLREFAVLSDGLKEAKTRNLQTTPLSDHPRRGILAHPKPDSHPEYFASRGIGTDNCPGCFVCGGTPGTYANIAALVVTEAAGKRVLAMFDKPVRLDYRHLAPDWIQVKVGACEQHVPNLEKLHELTIRSFGMICSEVIREAIEFNQRNWLVYSKKGGGFYGIQTNAFTEDLALAQRYVRARAEEIVRGDPDNRELRLVPPREDGTSS